MNDVDLFRELNTMKPKVLVDISLANQKNGFAGIPQDTRVIFTTLCETPTIDIDGLVYGMKEFLNSNIEDLYSQTSFFAHICSRNGNLFNEPLINKLLRKISSKIADESLKLLFSKNKFNLYPLNQIISKEIIWRNFFCRTSTPSQKNNVLNKQYVLSQIGVERLLDAATGKAAVPYLDTKNYDFALFSYPRSVKVHKNTKKLIRFHDGLPIFCPDTFASSAGPNYFWGALKQCAPDSYFVCNSPNSEMELQKIIPEASNRTFVIPCAHPNINRVYVDPLALNTILITRFSPIHKIDVQEVTSKWFAGINSIPKFVMSLATIEPRKNYLGLISAWQRLRAQTNSNLKLMIVGSPGWNYELSLAAMKPHIENGDLVHLEDVSTNELSYLYSSASCFVFPSFAEGFGIPPIEAMQCGCPVALSSAPAHLYSAGNGALYFDPYDEFDMCEKIQKIVFPESPSFVSELVANGYKNVARFSKEEVLALWENLFENLKLQS